jgi:DNA repair protein RadA/Sms
LAVLEKRVGLRIGNSDVFVKVAGGIKVDEPAVDLAATVALASSYRNRSVSAGTVVIGEVGLAGEVRAVAGAEVRIREAARMGFHTMILPKSNLKGLEQKESIKLIGVETVAQALDAALQ